MNHWFKLVEELKTKFVKDLNKKANGFRVRALVGTIHVQKQALGSHRAPIRNLAFTELLTVKLLLKENFLSDLNNCNTKTINFLVEAFKYCLKGRSEVTIKFLSNESQIIMVQTLNTNY